LRPALVAAKRKPLGMRNWEASDMLVSVIGQGVNPFTLTGELEQAGWARMVAAGCD